MSGTLGGNQRLSLAGRGREPIGRIVAEDTPCLVDLVIMIDDLRALSISSRVAVILSVAAIPRSCSV
jgi:hypothetical protein